MPYQKSERLPAERASKIGHLEVLQSPLVQKLCKNFENTDFFPEVTRDCWKPLTSIGKEINIIFSADGSIQTIESSSPPYKAISFVKTALFALDKALLKTIDGENPNPFALRDMMKKSAIYHATAFPLRHVKIPDKTIYHGVREILFESIKDNGKDNAINGALMDTLKWLVYEKWNDKPKEKLENFGCPYCDIEKNVNGQSHATLKFDEEKGNCPNCRNEIFITDSFGLHQTMTDDYAPNQVALDYMSVCETLMILTPVRYFWDTNKDKLKNCLLIKDGPLSLRATLAKLSAPIRRFFKYSKENNYEIAMFGQEKSGLFWEHLQLIGKNAPENSYFIPNNNYIRNEIQHSNLNGTYGTDTNYGAKIFIKLNDYHKMVLNIPTGERGEYVESPSIENLIRVHDIIATLPKIISNKYEGAILPIELANGVASLSTYPSAKVLELFSDQK